MRGHVVRGHDGRSTRRATHPGLRSAVLVGVGSAATVDQVVFHEILHWHAFYTGSGRDVGLVWDGLFHAAASLLLAAALVCLVRAAFLHRLPRRFVAGGVLTGAGGFNLFDGVVDHKILRIHQIREGAPNLLPYDVTWIVGSCLLLGVGLVLLRRSRPGAPPVDDSAPVDN